MGYKFIHRLLTRALHDGRKGHLGFHRDLQGFALETSRGFHGDVQRIFVSASSYFSRVTIPPLLGAKKPTKRHLEGHLQGVTTPFTTIVGTHLVHSLRLTVTLPKFNSSPLKIGRNPKGNEKVFQPPFFSGELLNFGGLMAYLTGKICKLLISRHSLVNLEICGSIDFLFGFQKCFKIHTSIDPR